jgi:signal transduction histidine kinase
VTAKPSRTRAAKAATATIGSARGPAPGGPSAPPESPGAPEPGATAAPPAGDQPVPSAPAAADRVAQLAFLHEFAQLLTEARDWDELMRTLVDRTTAALGVEVCSFYLLDRDGSRLTLAATNGLDREQVGRVSLAIGQGITGRAARTRQPVATRDVTVDPQFSWVRGFDVHGLHAMLSMPLVWNEQLVGVLNVQTTAVREFTPDEVDFLDTIAALLGGLVEKGRMQAEAEAQLDRLSQLDAARAELLAVVTHELRTPLAVVRAYVDLLADAAAHNAPDDRRAQVETWRAGTVDQVTRLDRLVDGILASVRGEGLTGLRREPFDVVAAISGTVGTLALLLRTRAVRWYPPNALMPARGDEARFQQVLEQILDNEAKYAPPEEAVSIGVWRIGDEVHVYITDDGPGVPIEDWEAVFEPYVRLDRARSRGSGIGLFAARRLMEGMGGRVWIEKNGYGGSRFMIALPAV